MKDVTDNREQESFKDKFNAWAGRSPGFRPGQVRWLYLLLALLLALYYYFVLPAIHYAALDFWIFLAILSIGSFIIEWLVNIAEGSQYFSQTGDRRGAFRRFKLPKPFRWLLAFWIVVLVAGSLAHFIFSPLFFAEGYANMIQIETQDFAEDFPETDLSQIPLVDRDTAVRLGNRQLGALTHLVSQFEAAPDYTQININDKPYRVSPLQYVDFFRWLNNFRKGIPYYIAVDNVTGEVDLVQTPEPMRYSYSDLFFRNVLRRLRLANPFTLFDQPAFEVDDEGYPYYVATTYSRNFFIREPEPTGVILLDAITGESTYYDLDSIPQWVDRVYPSQLILHQITMQGHYRNGFWNSLFAKEGVTEPTAGYNYLPMDNDLYLYTGITSVAADDSNIGFVLSNLRTKETVMFPLTAAEEFSAMQSAEGAVQETSYQATFPLLINIGGRPLYILTLKDNSGLIKEYALVHTQDYQRVYTAPTLDRLIALYAEENPVDTTVLDESKLAQLSGMIEEIQAVVIDGNTVYYFTLDGEIYTAAIHLHDQLPFAQAGDGMDFQAAEGGQVVHIQEITRNSGD